MWLAPGYVLGIEFELVLAVDVLVVQRDGLLECAPRQTHPNHVPRQLRHAQPYEVRGPQQELHVDNDFLRDVVPKDRSTWKCDQPMLLCT